MPLLASFLFGVFTKIFELFAKKFTVNAAIGAAYVATITAAYLAIKTAVAATGLIAGAVLPPALVTVFSMVLPSTIPSKLTALWVIDATLSGWAWFQQRVPILYQLGKV